MSQNTITALTVGGAYYLAGTILAVVFTWHDYREAKKDWLYCSVSSRGLAKAARRVLLSPLWPVMVVGYLARQVNELLADAKSPQ